MTAYHQGQPYFRRHDNPPELIEALSLWSFPADFDPAQLPTGMFCCVLDEWRRIERQNKGLPPESPQPVPAKPKPIEVMPVKKQSRNMICILGASIAAFGYGAYLNGHHVGGSLALLLSAAIYFSMPSNGLAINWA